MMRPPSEETTMPKQATVYEVPPYSAMRASGVFLLLVSIVCYVSLYVMAKKRRRRMDEQNRQVRNRSDIENVHKSIELMIDPAIDSAKRNKEEIVLADSAQDSRHRQAVHNENQTDRAADAVCVAPADGISMQPFQKTCSTGNQTLEAKTKRSVSRKTKLSTTSPTAGNRPNDRTRTLSDESRQRSRDINSDESNVRNSHDVYSLSTKDVTMESAKPNQIGIRIGNGSKDGGLTGLAPRGTWPTIEKSRKQNTDDDTKRSVLSVSSPDCRGSRERKTGSQSSDILSSSVSTKSLHDKVGDRSRARTVLPKMADNSQQKQKSDSANQAKCRDFVDRENTSTSCRTEIDRTSPSCEGFDSKVAIEEMYFF